MGFVNRVDQSVANYRIGVQMKKWRWSPFVWMLILFFRLREYYIVLTKEGDESLPFLVFWRHLFNAVFLKYSKESRLSLCYVRIRNIPSDVSYDVTKHYQVQSKYRRTQIPFKHLRWSVFAQKVNTLTRYTKKLHLRCLKGFWIYLCCRARQM